MTTVNALPCRSTLLPRTLLPSPQCLQLRGVGDWGGARAFPARMGQSNSSAAAQSVYPVGSVWSLLLPLACDEPPGVTTRRTFHTLLQNALIPSDRDCAHRGDLEGLQGIEQARWNEREPRKNSTPLMVAATNGHLQIVRVLLTAPEASRQYLKVGMGGPPCLSLAVWSVLPTPWMPQVDATHVNADARSALHFAAHGGQEVPATMGLWDYGTSCSPGKFRFVSRALGSQAVVRRLVEANCHVGSADSWCGAPVGPYPTLDEHNHITQPH